MKTPGFRDKISRQTRRIAYMRSLGKALFVLLIVLHLIYFVFLKAYYMPQWFCFKISANLLMMFALGVPVLAGLLIFWLENHDIKHLIMAVEKHYPHLQDRLITAIEFSQPNQTACSNPFSQLLAKSLQDEMNEVMDRCGFGRAASPRKIVLPVVLILIFLAMGTVHALVQPDFMLTAYRRVTGKISSDLRAGAGQAVVPQWDIQVVPGNCEIASGSNILIQAQVIGSSQPIRRAELHIQSQLDSGWQILPMTRSGENAFQYTLAHVTSASTYYVKAEQQESARFEIRLYEALKLERAIWKIDPPAYTNLPIQQRQGWREQLTVPRNTRLSLELNFNRPVQPGWLTVQGDHKFKLEKGSAQQLNTNFTASEDMVLRMEVQGVQGEPVAGVPSLWIQTIPDLSPYLEVLEPQLQNYVFPTEEVPFEISANDDYGLSRVTLVIRYQGKETRIEWLPTDTQTDKIVLHPVLDLERFQLRSRDLVFAYVELQDNYPGNDVHIVRSPLFTLLIRDYVETFKNPQPDAVDPSLRMLFESVMIEQESIMQDTWDYISRLPTENPAGGDVAVIPGDETQRARKGRAS